MQLKMILFIFLFSLGFIIAQTEETKLGNEITLTEKTNISDIISNPDLYLDKTVVVEGEVLDICPMMGCWMELKSDANDDRIKVKVKDGDIIFPMEAIGSTAMVEGKVYKIELTQEEAVEYFQHVAEEKGEKFDPSTITGAMTIYQIKGLGAEIHKKKI